MCESFLHILIHNLHRIDAAKHMWPGDLSNIYNRLNNLNTEHGFASNTRPFIYQEVIDLGGEAVSASEYTSIATVTEFKYGLELSSAFQGNNALRWLTNFGEAWGLLTSGDSLVFIDNHDNQRGHGAGGSILTYKNSKPYKVGSGMMMLLWVLSVGLFPDGDRLHVGSSLRYSSNYELLRVH